MVKVLLQRDEEVEVIPRKVRPCVVHSASDAGFFTCRFQKVYELLDSISCDLLSSTILKTTWSSHAGKSSYTREDDSIGKQEAFQTHAFLQAHCRHI